MIKWTNREQQILSQLRIGADINEEYKQQPGIRARFGFLLARANAEVARLKEQIAQVESDIADDVTKRIRRRKADEINAEEARAYRWEVDREVKRDPRLMRVVKAQRRATFDAEILKHAIAAIDHRKDMLVGLGASLREEHSSYITLLTKQAKERLGHRKD